MKTRRVIREGLHGIVHWRRYGGGNTPLCNEPLLSPTFDEDSIDDSQPMNCLRCSLIGPHHGDLSSRPY